MEIIFTVSPTYLEALYKEAEPFNFRLQGYGNFTDAIQGLQFVNRKDLVGFLYADDKLPDKLDQFHSFLHMCNLAANAPTPFLVALCNEDGLAKIIDTKRYNNLEFMHVPKIEVFTDLLIKRDLFGTLLLQKFEPYLLEPAKEQSVCNDIPVLEYKPIFAPEVLRLLRKPKLDVTADDTLMADDYYLSMKDSNPTLAKLRRCFIKVYFGCNIVTELTEIEIEVSKITDCTEFCTYMSLISLIKEVACRAKQKQDNRDYR